MSSASRDFAHVLFIDFQQMGRLCSIDATLVRLLGEEFSVVGCCVKSLAKKFVEPLVIQAEAERRSLAVDFSAISSDSVIVLCINLFSFITVQMMSSQLTCDPSQVELVEFLLRVFGEASKKPDSLLDAEKSARLSYASLVFASAAASHFKASLSGDLSGVQVFQKSMKPFYSQLQRCMAKSSSYLQSLQIIEAAHRILLEGCSLPEPPVSLISRYGPLTFEEKQSASSDLLRTFRSLPSSSNSGIKETSDITNALLHDLIALNPPTDPESKELVHTFFKAVDAVAQHVDPTCKFRGLQWSTRPVAKGCGGDCSNHHSEDGNCLVCGFDWGNHGGHTCNRAPFSGLRGSWLSASQQSVSQPLQIETTAHSMNVAFDPKPGKSEGIQSEMPLENDPDHQVGTIITFNITHSAASTPKVMLGLTSSPPPLTPPIEPKVDVGLDLGQLKVISSDSKHPIDNHVFRKAMSFSRSSVIK
jgi:hypothetical protein